MCNTKETIHRCDAHTPGLGTGIFQAIEQVIEAHQAGGVDGWFCHVVVIVDCVGIDPSGSVYP